MTLRLCKRCFTMKNIRGNKLLCKKCEKEFDELAKIEKTYDSYDAKDKQGEQK